MISAALLVGLAAAEPMAHPSFELKGTGLTAGVAAAWIF